MEKTSRFKSAFILAAMMVAYAPAALPSQQFEGCARKVSATISVDQGHPWRPPFGLDRVGQQPAVRLELTMPQDLPVREYWLVGYREGKEVERHSITTALTYLPPYTVPFYAPPDEVALMARCRLGAEAEEIARTALAWPELEAEAVVHADRRVNPIDLGTVLVPHEWLLLTGGQVAVIDVAALSRGRDLPKARLRTWFEGDQVLDVAMPLTANIRTVKELKLPLVVKSDRSVLHVSLTDGSRELWKKDIRTMIVDTPPHWPAFGAVEAKLRYDAPISVKNPRTGTFSSLDYDTAWNRLLNDVVVFLPNGSRFVFWRGSSYIPFWAGRYNTGFSYQWVETNRRDSIDVAEPLMDRELRYGRVRILESTTSRVHVRWTYQLSDFEYKVWGDEASEDFYFYPDGFGTRVVTLTSPLNNESYYSVSESIVLLPQSAHPLDVLPEIHIDLLTLDGGKRQFVLPRDASGLSSRTFGKLTDVQLPTLYRFSIHKDDLATAIYFSPQNTSIGLYAFKPFYDQGKQVTPAYWGEHWPLGRGSMTGAGISDRIYLNPSHISIAAWFTKDDRGHYIGPESPLSVSTGPTVDPLGRPSIMNTQRWVWMIAHTDMPDAELRDWGQSFSTPPAIELTGARLDYPAYSIERRSLRLVAQHSSITIKLKPQTRTVNPVFEIDQAPKRLVGVTLNGKALPSKAYAWDGAVLWIESMIGAEGATFEVRFQ